MLRHAVMTALARARERVAHGAPSLAVALYYQELTERAWAQVDRAIDDVRFEPRPAPFAQAPAPRKGEGPEVAELRELLASSREVSWLPWEDPGGLTRAECVSLLTAAMLHAQAAPSVNYGPLFAGAALALGDRHL